MRTESHLEKVTFDVFEVDVRAEEVWRGPRKVRCQRQPFKVLLALLEHAGEVVSREELQQAIWGSESPSDADHSLGIAVNKLRDALGDSAETPRFVETLSRRGYRFIAPIEVTFAREEMLPAPDESSVEFSSNMQGDSIPPESSKRYLLWGAAALVLAITVAVAVWNWGSSRGEPARIDQITHNDSLFPGVPAMESFPVLATDGSRVYSATLENGQTQIAAIDPQTGEMQPLELPSEIVNPTLGDVSPDGSRLLVLSHASSDAEQPVWVVPRAGGSGLRAGNILAHDAIWMPDGQGILFATDNKLQVLHLNSDREDNTVTTLATVRGRAFRMRWAPNGHVLRVTVLDPLTHTSAIWQIEPGHTPTPVLPGWTTPAQECCGVWTADGKMYVFSSGHGGPTDLWTVPAYRLEMPRRLTNGPLRFTAPTNGGSNGRLYFIGLDVRSALQRYDPAIGRFVGERNFLAGATRASYSRDRQWVAWTDSSGHLWRARAADGAEKVQLTPDPLQVFLAQWSPDGKRLVMMAHEPGSAWQLFVVSADGGVPQQLLHENRNEADPSWSPDGLKVVFGRTPDLMGGENGPKQIEILNLQTRAVTTVPGSEGLFSPRWSPDGRWIAALTLGGQKLMLFDVVTQKWNALGAEKTGAAIRSADPVWAADSQSIYVHAAFSKPQTIECIAVPDGTTTVAATLANPLISDEADAVFVGIDRGERPLIRVRTATGNLYAMQTTPVSR